MNIDWKRDILLNLFLFTVFLTAVGVQTGHITVLTHTQMQEKTNQTIHTLDKQHCLTFQELQNQLDMSRIEYEVFLRHIQKQKLILHYDCGFKLTAKGKIQAQLKTNSSLSDKLPKAPTK